MRLKKGVADRYWEDLVFAIIGDQFADTSDDVCGAVLSVRNGEDILSIWTRDDSGRVLKIKYVQFIFKGKRLANEAKENNGAHPRLPPRHENRMEVPRFLPPTASRNRRSTEGEIKPKSTQSPPRT